MTSSSCGEFVELPPRPRPLSSEQPFSEPVVRGPSDSGSVGAQAWRDVVDLCGFSSDPINRDSHLLFLERNTRLPALTASLGVVARRVERPKNKTVERTRDGTGIGDYLGGHV